MRPAVKSGLMANKADTNHKQNLEAEESRVTSLELFFDLVFVFTLTQLTSRLAESLSWESLRMPSPLAAALACI